MADGPLRRSPVVSWLVAAGAENLGLKVTSLVIAMALFGMVRGAGNMDFERWIELSVVSRLPPAQAHRVLLTELPDTVRVLVRGPRPMVGSLRPEEIGPLQLDLADGRRTTIRLDASMFDVPGGVHVDQVLPPAIRLAWDDLVERDVPVRALIDDAPQPGARLAAAPTVTPATVHVTGPALYVGGLSAVRTEPVEVAGLGPGDYVRRVALEAPRRMVRYESSEGVRVNFRVERTIVERRFERLAVTPVGAGRVQLRPALATVVLRGTPDALAAVQPADLVPAVTLPAAGAAARGNQTAPVQLAHPPAGTTLVQIEPAEVIVVPVR